jgi:hypothetical protein
MVVDRASTGMALESEPGGQPFGVRGLMMPAVIALVVAAVVLAVVVGLTPSVWLILGAGNGLIPETYYPVWGFVLVLATTLGQVGGWAGGSAVLYYVLTLVGFARGSLTAKVAMSVTYVGLGAGPLLAYHVLFGGPLLGLPRTGLSEWLLANHPDAHGLLVAYHPVVDLAVIPLGVLFLGVLWISSDRARSGVAVRTILALALVGTSLAVALSLAMHAAIVHVRLG